MSRKKKWNLHTVNPPTQPEPPPLPPTISGPDPRLDPLPLSNLGPEHCDLPPIVPWWQRCPVCWDQSKGVGQSRSTPSKKLGCQVIRVKKYLQCDQCGIGFLAIFKPSEALRVEYRTPIVNERKKS